MLLLDLWGKSSGPYMQAIHFSFGLGAFTAPLLAVPFIAHTPAVNGSAAVLFGRNHLHTAQLPSESDLPEDRPEASDIPDLPGHLTNRPEHHWHHEVADLVTRPPALVVTRRSSVKGDDSVEQTQFVKLGMALAGGDAAARFPRSAERVEPEQGPETVQGLQREALTATEVRKSSVAREGVSLTDGKGDPGGEGGVGTAPAIGAVTELEMTGDSGGEGTVTDSGDDRSDAAEVSVAPSLATMENSGIVTASQDGTAATTSATVTAKTPDDDSTAGKVALSKNGPAETQVNLANNGADGAGGDGEAQAGVRADQNRSEESMHDATPDGSLNLTESPLDVTTVDSTANVSEATEEPVLQHTPKPKPVFTDGNKLEHDQTWARPPLKAPHPAPAEAATHPDAAVVPPTARPDSVEAAVTAQTNSSALNDSTTAPGDEKGTTTPASVVNSEASGGDGEAIEAGGKATGGGGGSE